MRSPAHKAGRLRCTSECSELPVDRKRWMGGVRRSLEALLLRQGSERGSGDYLSVLLPVCTPRRASALSRKTWSVSRFCCSGIAL